MPLGTVRRTLVALAVPLLTLAGSSLGMSPHPEERLTDDRTIDVVASEAVRREILWTPAVPVDGTVNTAVDEYEPRVSADGTTLVFVRRRPGGNADLFAARWTPAGWSDPKPIDSINSDQDELGPELSRDGKRLYFYSDREGGLGGYDLWMSERASEGDVWPAATNLGPTVNSTANEYGPALVPDGSRLYFASNRPRPGEPDVGSDAWTATIREQRSRHDYDLYATINGEGGWKAAEVVAALATAADEGSPAVSPAGDFLYFASDRSGGLGGYDLYRVRLAPEGEPLHPSAVGVLIESLGDAINSTGNELDPGLASEGFRIYFSSDRSGLQASGPVGYELFTSTSREVRRFTAPEQADRAAGLSAWFAFWETIWPWLLLFALLAALAYLLAKLFAHHEAWRQRIGRMGLLARCLLVSLLLHLLVAALLTAWKVGGIVVDRLSGGGHRVLLASGSPDSASAELTHQVLADITTPDRAVLDVPLTRSEPAPSVVEEREAVQTRPDPMLVRDATIAERRDDIAPIEPGPPQPIEPTSIVVEATTPVAPPPSAAAHDDAPVPSAAARPIAVASLDSALTEVFDRPATESPLPLEPTTAGLPPAPTAAAAPASEAPPPRRDENLELASPVAAVAARVPHAATPVPAAAPSVESPLPSAAHSASSRDALQPMHASATPMAPLSAPAEPTRPAPTPLDVPSATTTTSATQSLLDQPSPPEFATMTLPVLASGVGAVASQLPVAPAPLEDFAQRDPSLRSELLEGMGGSDETERAVVRALEWLKRSQEADGRWSSRGHGGTVDADAAMTGLALLTFLGAGHTHVEDGPYRDAVARGLAWLRARQQPNGDLRSNLPGVGADAAVPADTMYGQTIATVALCEAYAMSRDATLAAPTRLAIAFVLERAERARRGPTEAADTAVLGWLVMTVESARRAGFSPPAEVFDSARSWLDSVSVSRLGGRYAYEPNQTASPAMTAEAMFVQQLIGDADRKPSKRRMDESAEFIADTLPRWSGDAPTHHWYYATLALFQHQGEHWERWNAALRGALLEHQREDGPDAGSWDPQDRWSRAGGRVYQTAVCALSLEVYYRYRVPSANRPSSPGQ
ncbi:MAG: PD40 domain-containing protein [Phycisphaerae bacterium]|nr:PD40 domain-containing protein [Phycisphaerae bacterium]